MRKAKAAFVLALIAIGMGASLSGCIIEERGGGGYWHHHYDRDWRYR
jgi:hypothetical protein